MEIWTIYNNPLDYPGLWVARRWEIGPGTMRSTDDVRIGQTLDEVRMMLPLERGLARIPRRPDDDPVIWEVWL